MQIGITLIGILAGAFSVATIAAQFEASLIENGVRQGIAELGSIGVVVIALTFLSLVIGELVPKLLGLTRSDAIASRVAPAIELVARMTHPVVTLLQFFTEGVLSVVGMRSEQHAGGHRRRDQGVARRRRAKGPHRFFRATNDRSGWLTAPSERSWTHRRELIWLDVKDSEQEVRPKMTDNGIAVFSSTNTRLGYVPTRAIVDRLLDRAPLDLRTMIREPLRVVPGLKTVGTRVTSLRCPPLPSMRAISPTPCATLAPRAASGEAGIGGCQRRIG